MVNALSDLSDLDVDTVQKMIVVDNLCAESGIGSHYGQLVMLGYKVDYAGKLSIYSFTALPNNLIRLFGRAVKEYIAIFR